MSNNNSLNWRNANLRRFLLITLSGPDIPVERFVFDKNLIAERLRKAMICTSIIVARGEHPSQVHNFYIGIWNEQGFPRGSAVRLIKSAFPEFEDAQVNVTFQRTWNTLCKCVLKESKDPLVWGKHSLEQILEMVKAKAQHRKSPPKINDLILPTLKDLDGESQSKVVESLVSGASTDIVSDAGYEANLMPGLNPNQRFLMPGMNLMSLLTYIVLPLSLLTYIVLR